MTRVLRVVAVIAVALLSSGPLLAQSNLFIGTWKLNVAKCKYVNVPIQAKSETRTLEAQGDTVKISLDGVDGDGTRIAYSYTSKFDGKDSPVTGEGARNEEDTVAVKLVNASTFTATTKRAGKVIRTVRGVVSKDGKVTTLHTIGLDAQGRPVTAITVWEKM